MRRRRFVKKKSVDMDPDARYFEFMSMSGELRRIKILHEKHLKILKKRHGRECYKITRLIDDIDLYPKHMRERLRASDDDPLFLDAEVCVRTLLEDAD